MYHPLAGKPEFIEVRNVTVTPLDMAKWRFTDGIEFTLPDFNPGSNQAHFLKSNERILVSSATEAATRAAYPGIPTGVRIFGPWTGALDNAGERVTLVDKNGVVMATLDYGDSGKWPIAPDGTGHSLVLNDDLQMVDDWRLWRSSVNNGGSPGVADPAPLAAGIALNEVYFSPVTGRAEWVEVRNNSLTATLSLSGLALSAALDLSGAVALSGSLAPGAVASFAVDFAPDNNGNLRLFLFGASSQVRDAVMLRRIAGRPSWQVFPPGSREWYSDTTATQNTPNNPARNEDIVINEIMADPPSNQRDGEFIELYNRGASAVDVGGWQLDDGVNFTIPAGTIIPAGGYLVIGANAAWLNANYPGLTAIGNYDGSLSNNGERVRLEDANGNLADQVDYRFGGEWPELAGGNGSSLELVNPLADNAIGSAWKDSDESTKSTFTSFTINGGTYAKSTNGGVQDDEILLWLTGDAHIIIRNPVLRPTAGGANLFVNGGVTTLNNNNDEGWQSRGTHWAGYHDAEGVHIVADGHGDNKCNHAEKAAPGMLANTAYTMTFDARWVYGKPRLVAQSWDTSWGGTVQVPIPANLGTPGAQNSRYTANPAPQITNLRHSPVTPTVGSTVTVTARVSSATPLSSVQLWHRLDNASYNGVWNTTPMNDVGTGGDAVAGDGIYTVQIPLVSFGYNGNGVVVEFYAKANAANGESAWLPRGSVQTEPLATSPPRTALWVVDSQVAATDLRRMRIVMSAYWLGALDTPGGAAGGGGATYNYKFPRFSNHYFPCTFVHNDAEPYYGASARKSGSPFTRQTDNQLTRGRVTLPGDKPFRGHNKLYWDNDAAGGSMLNNRVHRYYLYLLGVPANENEVCRVTRNSLTYAVRETNEVFDKDMLDRIWPNGSDGQFFEIDDKFHIADDGHTRLANADGSWDYKLGDSQGADNPTAYHNNFTPKSREPEYDYNTLIEWCRQIELFNGSLTHAQIERMVDTQALTAYAAVRGYSADWDNITINRGKNGFFYNRSTDHRWMLIHWDSDNTFQANQINIPVIGSLTNVNTYYARPVVRRYLNYYLSQMIGPLTTTGARMTAWLTAEENSSPSFNVPTTYAAWPSTIATSGTAQTRIAVIQQFIGATALNATFATTSPANNTTVATNTVTVNGTAPPGAFSILCVNHPEAVLSWTGNASNTAPWALAGIRLATGANLLTFRAFDADGAQVGTDITLTINKNGDAPPIAEFTSSPASQNVALGQLLMLDGTSSYDPEGTALSYAWSVVPATGFTMSAPSPAARNIYFSVPGTYTVTLQVTDGANQSTTVARTFSVFSSNDFDNFSGKLLTGYTLNNVKLLDNHSPDAWYSLNETEGSLVLALGSTLTYPLRATAAAFPTILRPLPATADFLLQTNFVLETRQFGSFFTGLYLETVESSVATRYAFGLENGTNFKVYRSAGAASYSQIGTLAYASGDVVLRVQRTGGTLNFQFRTGGTWTNVVAYNAGVATTVANGGLFASSGTVNSSPLAPGQGLRVAFDYLLLGNPANTTGLVGNLRITELMYNPAGSGGVEFLELRNIGAIPINLQGAYFADGAPFSTQFTFGNRTLAPGEFCVVTNNATAFTSLYGNSAIIAGQYTGALSNDGEPIRLFDPAGNTIHDFEYDDVAPWPATADGLGPSMEVLTTDPALYAYGENWRASAEVGGSPGYLGLAFDSDGDGFADTYEQIFGANPHDAASTPASPALSTKRTANTYRLSWAAEAGRTYTVQYRDSLTSGAWQSLGQVTADSDTASYTDTVPPGQPQRFYRVTTRLP